MKRLARKDLVPLLNRLEVPDCGCPFLDEFGSILPPCAHVLAVHHDLTLVEWAELLLFCLPRQYREPPRAAGGAMALTREARIGVYIARQRAGLSLYHPADLWRIRDRARAGVAVRRGKNGSLFETGVIPD